MSLLINWEDWTSFKLVETSGFEEYTLVFSCSLLWFGKDNNLGDKDKDDMVGDDNDDLDCDLVVDLDEVTEEEIRVGDTGIVI